MSMASHSLTLTSVSTGETYSSLLTCSKGDLFQRYDTAGVYPDWEKDTSQRPVIAVHLASSSSASANGEDIPDSIEIYYDNNQVVFAAGAKTNSAANGVPAGMFQIDGGGAAPYTVTVLKNFCSAGATGQPGHMIKVISVKGGNRLPASIAVDIRPLTETGEEVHLVGMGATPYVVNQESGTSCILEAVLYRSGAEVTNYSAVGRTFSFDKQVAVSSQYPDGWMPVTPVTGQPRQIEVKPSDVDSYAVYRVRVYNGTEMTASDTQSVMDIGDPFYIGVDVVDASGSPSSLAFMLSESDSAVRKLTANLYNRKTGAIESAIKKTWEVRDAAGVLLNSTATSTLAAYTDNTASISLTKGFLRDHENSVSVTSYVEYNG